jgi:hypothetical protein
MKRLLVAPAFLFFAIPALGHRAAGAPITTLTVVGHLN